MQKGSEAWIINMHKLTKWPNEALATDNIALQLVDGVGLSSGKSELFFFYLLIHELLSSLP